jgi:uncharacterized protein
MSPPLPPPLSDAELARLESLLDALPAPLQALDISAVDGFLCGVLLQPQAVPTARWLPWVRDVEGRPLPAGAASAELDALLLRRHAELELAIGQRQWFDPWIYELDADAAPGEPLLPWVAGFAAAMEAFPALMTRQGPELLEPLALIFLHLDPADLEDAEELQAVIDTLEPPTDLAEAVQDLVRALMLIADVTRPPRPAPRPAGAARSRRGGR